VSESNFKFKLVLIALHIFNFKCNKIQIRSSMKVIRCIFVLQLYKTNKKAGFL